ncbi:MAG: HEAT repeat domain-containing protein [Chloroflexi bacterium]|nr:HEAT repeat domain-containing protein [Chloroflexota bacterium]
MNGFHLGERVTEVGDRLLAAKSPLVRRFACRMLGVLRTAPHPDALSARLEDDRTRSAACWALGRLRDPGAVEGLVACLEDREPSVRRAACRALGRMGDRRALESLIRHAGDALPRVSRTACRALSQLGERRLSSAIRTALRGHPSQIAELAAEGDFRSLEALLTRIRPRMPPGYPGGYISGAFCRVIGESLRALGSPAVDRLIELLAEDSADPTRRAAICDAIGESRDIRAVEPLIARLVDPSQEVRTAARLALEQVGSGRLAEAFFDAFEWNFTDSNWHPRPAPSFQALRDLVAAGDRRPPDMLAQFVADARGGVRRSAWIALGHLGDSRAAVEPLITRLSDQITVQERESICEALGDLADPRAVEPLIMSLEHSPGAVRALARIGDSRAVMPLISLVRGEGFIKSYQCEAVCDALGTLGDIRAVEPLISVLNAAPRNTYGGPSYTASHGCVAVCRALGKLGDVRALKALIARLSDEDDSVLEGAALALGNIRDYRAVEALVKALAHYRPALRRASCDALAMLGDSRAVDALINRLSDAHLAVRSGATLALENLGEGRLAGAVRWLPDSERVGDLIAFAREGDLRGLNAAANLSHRLSKISDGAPLSAWRKTEKAVRPLLGDMLCSSCLVRLAQTRLGNNWDGVKFFACRTCGIAKGLMCGVSDVTVLLDDRWGEEMVRTDGRLRVNWFRRRSPFDFNRVEFLSASEYEVQLFLVAVGNDTDEWRRKRYPAVTCTISCPLAENTTRILQSTFDVMKRR